MIVGGVLSFAIFITILSLCVMVYKRRKYVNAINKIPGPALKPGTGQFHNKKASPEKGWQKMRQWGRQYYPIYKVWAFHFCFVVMLSPEDVQILLSSPTYIKKGFMYHTLKQSLRTGLLTSSGEKWQKRRKILNPTFHFNMFIEYVKVFVKQTETLIQNIYDECDKPYTDLFPLISKCTLLVITETTMGTEMDLGNRTQREFLDSICRIGEIAACRLLRPWLYPDFLYRFSELYAEEKKLVDAVRQFARSVTHKRMEELKQSLLSDKVLEGRCGTRRCMAMLDLLIKRMLETGEIDEDGIQEEVDTFLVAEKVREEVKDVLEGSLGQLTLKDFQALPYLEMVIKESLRLYPSGPLISRTITEPITTNSGYYIPEGTDIIVDIQSLHLNPTHWPDPKKFDPDRFLPDNRKRQHPFAYIPFSAGPRSCIGQKYAMLEVKVILVGILRNFVLLPEDTPETIVHTLNATNKPVHGIKIKFRRIKDSN